MNRAKSLFLTILVCGGVFGGLFFIPIEKGNKIQKESNFPVVTAEEELLGTGEEEILEIEKVEVPPVILPIEEPKKEETAPEPVKEKPQPTTPLEQKNEPQKPTEKEVKKEEPKKETEKKVANKKEETPQQQPQKESKIGVDRKLISGVPGTMKYKGKLPAHNVKEKGSITISYTVDANGNVVSAYRIDGLRSRNAINNAITMVKKYVKAEKAKSNSTGTYTIDFK